MRKTEATPEENRARRETFPPSRLPRYLALAYTALIAYASLHPFSGWHDTGLSPFSFLDAGWPRYWTFFDLGVNVLAYLPLGFLLTLALRRRLAFWSAAPLALAGGTALSFAIETVQSWLPARVASNLDWACNTLGAAIGIVLAVWQGELFFRRVARVQHRILAPLPHAELGLLLIALWQLTQFSPETTLFGTGDLRHLLDIPAAVPYAAHSFFALETGIIACNTVAIGLIVRSLLAARRAPYAALSLFFAVALALRTLAAAILVDPAHALAWLTPGAGLGLLAGGGALTILLLLPAALRLALAGLALMAATVLVNVAPFNPYSSIALATWKQGHFLNFNGLTRLTASFWPFLALPFLTLLGRRH